MKRLCLLVGCVLALGLPTSSQAGVSSELNGLGSFGISVGAMRWLADSDAAEWEGNAAQIRPIGKMVFRYRFSDQWAATVETGFGWNSYADSDNLVHWVIPTTVGAERRLGQYWGMTASLNVGGGIYVWGRRRGGNFLRDDVTQQKYHAADPGAFVGLVGEYHVDEHVTLTHQLTTTYIYSAHSDDFKAALGDDDLFVDVRIGVNYYFSTREGLILSEPEGAAEGR